MNVIKITTLIRLAWDGTRRKTGRTYHTLHNLTQTRLLDIQHAVVIEHPLVEQDVVEGLPVRALAQRLPPVLFAECLRFGEQRGIAGECFVVGRLLGTHVGVLWETNGRAQVAVWKRVG
jgi:hypothetical protein